MIHYRYCYTFFSFFSFRPKILLSCAPLIENYFFIYTEDTTTWAADLLSYADFLFHIFSTHFYQNWEYHLKFRYVLHQYHTFVETIFSLNIRLNFKNLDIRNFNINWIGFYYNFQQIRSNRLLNLFLFFLWNSIIAFHKEEFPEQKIKFWKEISNHRLHRSEKVQIAK